MEEKRKNPQIDFSLTKKEIKFSNRVRLSSGKAGFLLTFAQNHPDSEEALCIGEIHLPPLVAGSLASILMAHVANYEKKYNTKITPPGLQLELQVEEIKTKKEDKE